MTKEEFKRRWELDDNGDCADCYVAWGLGHAPRAKPIAEVIDAVVRAAGVEEE